MGAISGTASPVIFTPGAVYAFSFFVVFFLQDRTRALWFSGTKSAVAIVDQAILLLVRTDLAHLLIYQEDDDEDEKDAPRTDRKRRGSLYIVLEYLEHDLAGLLDLNIT